MKPILVFSLLLLIGKFVFAQEDPNAERLMKPATVTELYNPIPIVQASTDHTAPSDGIVLYDGKNKDSWQKHPYKIDARMNKIDPIIRSLKVPYTSEPIEWEIQNTDLVVKAGTGAIATKQAFGDVQLHLEWNSPVDEGKSGQYYSNSGVFFMGLYEVQILNSFENETYHNGQASSVYKQHIPLVNASRPPGEWQVYDIIFMAPRFSEKGSLISPARITVFHNGILTQNNVSLLGPTCFIGTPYYVPHPSKLPLVLQDHGDPVRFRNIWIREL